MRKFEFGLEEAEKIFKKFGLSNPESIVRLEEGMINDVFSVDKKYVIKINTGNPEIPKLKKEKEIYNFLSGKIPVPKVYGYDSSKEILPYSYIIMQHVEGNSLERIYGELSEEQRDVWLVKLGELLALIHSFKFDQYGEDFSKSYFHGENNYSGFLKKYVDSVCQKLKNSGELEQKEIDKVNRFFLNSELFKINPPASLLHGNFVFGNVLASNNNISAIVDWEWCRSGHNEEELATFFYRVLKLEEASVNSFKQGYEKIIALPMKFEKRLYAYNLLYYLRILPEIKKWSHRPDKQKEYRFETWKLLKKIVG